MNEKDTVPANLGIKIISKRQKKLEDVKLNCEATIINAALEQEIQAHVLTKIEELLEKEKQLNS